MPPGKKTKNTLACVFTVANVLGTCRWYHCSILIAKSDFGVKNETGNHGIHGMIYRAWCCHAWPWAAMHCDTTFEPSPTVKRVFISPIAHSSELLIF